MKQTQPLDRPAKCHQWRLWASLLLLVLLSWLIVSQNWFENAASTIGYPGFSILAMVSSATFVIPGPVVAGAIAGAMYLNPFILGVFMGVGSGVGELPGYFVGRINHKEIVTVRGAKTTIRWMSRRPRLTLFVLAAVPNFLYDFAAITAGTMGVNTITFLAITTAGKIIRFSSIALLSNGILGQ